MQIIALENNRVKALASAVAVLRRGGVVVYPTDTSYGLGVSVASGVAVTKLYTIKGRDRNKPVHVLVPSIAYAREVVVWNTQAKKLAKNFWPGPLSMALPLKSKMHLPASAVKNLRKMSAGTGYMGLRLPDNSFAIALAKKTAAAISATSANVSGKHDAYSINDLLKQFKSRKYQPDLVIDAGVLPKVKPSTFVRISPVGVEVLRKGPVSESQIRRILANKL